MTPARLAEEQTEQFLVDQDLKPERFPEIHLNSAKTPDFKVSGPRGEFLYCEVKCIETETGPSGLLHDTVHNGLTRRLRLAAEQLESVNINHFVPNVLVWVSCNAQINFSDLVDLAGGAVRVGGSLLADLRRQRFGRGNRAWSIIDLHVWLYPWGEPDYLFVNNDSEHVVRLQRLFVRNPGC